MAEIKYMRKKGDSAIYIATEWLQKRDDMEFCDAPNKLNISSVNVPRETISEQSLSQKNLAEMNNNFVCIFESCGKAFPSARALHMHKVGAHRGKIA